MKRKISLYLREVVQNMRDAEEFIQGMSRQNFENDKKTVYAVRRAVEVIGEATNTCLLTPDERYPLIPWREMAGMRDMLIHDYIGVDAEMVVWLVCRAPAGTQMIEEEQRRLGGKRRSVATRSTTKAGAKAPRPFSRYQSSPSRRFGFPS